ncbi:hypothetical protein ACERIT_15185 (plasmid) [Halopenitus sp. H-Gu1]|uniref:hypothetical protein n=1 Tax=Halopenitus sp. H-Gu1 TaxID=3242697 RepID=UPI00359E08EF
MAITDSGDTDSAPLADDEIITKPEVGIDYGWYAEFELRGYMKREYRGSDHDYWMEPNLQRAQYYDPMDLPDDFISSRPKCSAQRFGTTSREEPLDQEHLCCNHPEHYEQALRDWPYFDVYDDRIVVPLGVMEQLDDTPVESHHYSDEFREKVLWPLAAHMVIFENFSREHPGHGVEYDGKWANFQTASNFYQERDQLNKYESLYLKKPDPRPIYVRVPPNHPMCELNRVIESRKKDNRTLLGSIVARDAATGTGKTTLAVQLAKTLDENGWTADMATLDPDTYAEKYTSEETPKQSCLILDEAEQAADNRRSSSHGNVKLSHLWATMRYREIYSLTTLPSASMLDKRLKELADLYIVVVERGVAVVYQTKVDDTEGENYLRRLHRVRWQPLDDDPEYQKLTEKKAERMENYSENYAYGDDEEEIDPDQVRHEAEMEKRNELIERMADLDFTQKEISEVVDLDRSTVSRILNGD